MPLFWATVSQRGHMVMPWQRWTAGVWQAVQVGTLFLLFR
jgi:hypothetical protein